MILARLCTHLLIDTYSCTAFRDVHTHLTDLRTHIYCVHMLAQSHFVSIELSCCTNHDVIQWSNFHVIRLYFWCRYLMYRRTFSSRYLYCLPYHVKAATPTGASVVIWGSSVQFFLWSNPPTSFLWTSREPNQVRKPGKKPDHAWTIHRNPVNKLMPILGFHG